MTKSRPGSRHRSLRNISTKPPIFYEAEGLTYCLYYARTGKCRNIRDRNIVGYRVRPGIVRHFTTSRAAPLTIMEIPNLQLVARSLHQDRMCRQTMRLVEPWVYWFPNTVPQRNRFQSLRCLDNRNAFNDPNIPQRILAFFDMVRHQFGISSIVISSRKYHSF